MPLTPEQIATMDELLNAGTNPQPVLDADTIAQMDAVASPKGFTSRVKEDLQERGDLTKRILTQDRPMVFNTAEALIRGGVGSAMDIGSNAVGAVGRGVASITPEFIKQPLSSAAEYVASSSPAQSLGRGISSAAEGYDAFSKRNPNTASALNVAGTMTGARYAAEGAKALADVAASPRTVKALLKDTSGTKFDAFKAKFDKQHNDFVKDLITPRDTPTVKEELFSKSREVGPFARREVVPSPYEQSVIDTVAGTGVKKGNSMLKNRMIIDMARAKEGKELLANLNNSNVIYSPSDMVPRLNNSVKRLVDDNPLIVGDGEKIAERVANKMLGLIQQQPGTPAGLLKARQDFDAWALSKNKGAFDGNSNAFKEAILAVREEANNYISEMVPDAMVRDSLTKQSHLFRAADAINSKGYKEATTNIGRGIQKLDNITPGNKFSRPAAAVGAAAIGSGAYLGSKK